MGVDLKLESNNVGAVLIRDDLMIQDGSSEKATRKKSAHILVSEVYLGLVSKTLDKPINSCHI